MYIFYLGNGMGTLGLIIDPLYDAELQKEDTVVWDMTMRPWLELLPRPCWFFDSDKNTSVPETTSDWSLFAFMFLHRPLELTIVPIHPDRPEDYEKALACDMVMFFIYNESEAWTMATPEKWRRDQRFWNLPNIYPPRSWQRIVDRKRHCYRLLEQRGIPVLPWIFCSREEFDQGPESIYRTIASFARSLGAARIVLRPEFGSCMTGVRLLTMVDGALDAASREMVQEVISEYPGIYITKFITTFDDPGEYKVYFIGDEARYVYLLQTDLVSEKQIDILMEPQNCPHPEAVAFAKRVYRILPQLTMSDGTPVSRVLTRIDVVWDSERKTFFVNEIEAVPSFLTTQTQYVLEPAIGQQTWHVFREYLLRKKARTVQIPRTPVFLLVLLLAVVWVVQTKIE